MRLQLLLQARNEAFEGLHEPGVLLPEHVRSHVRTFAVVQKPKPVGDLNQVPYFRCRTYSNTKEVDVIAESFATASFHDVRRNGDSCTSDLGLQPVSFFGGQIFRPPVDFDHQLVRHLENLQQGMVSTHGWYPNTFCLPDNLRPEAFLPDALRPVA